MNEPVAITIKRGRIRVLFAFEIGREVDLAEASKHVSDVGTTAITQMRARRGTPYFGFDPPPLSVQQVTNADFLYGELRADRLVELRVWPFGVVSVEYTIKIKEGTALEQLTHVRRQFDEAAELELDARGRVISLVSTLGDAVTDPQVANVVEDYVIAQIEECSGDLTASAFVKQNLKELIRFLRLEDPEDIPSRDVRRDILKGKFSWTTADALLIDWDGAIVFGKDNDEICKVLLLVQVQLLELKYLEHLLTTKANTVYDHVSKALRRQAPQARRSRRQRFWDALISRGQSIVNFVTFGLLLNDPLARTQAEVEQLELDVSEAYSLVANAVNLLGHATLHRIYTLATERVHFSELRQGIEKELENLKDLIERIESRKKTQEGHRMEFTVIMLIVVEIVLHLIGH